jgi:hypothetical protein
MAKNIDLGKTETNSFVKGLNKDSDSSFMTEGMWTHARNVVNNTIEGNLGTLSGEPANYLCAVAGSTLTGGRKVIVGAIHLFSDKWLIFTAVHNDIQLNSINSEIGLFEEDLCKYRPIVQDPCLNFNELNLIYGASREKEDCSWACYWNDGLNPDRYLNVGDPQTWPSDDYIWIGNNTYSNGVSNIQWPGVPWIQLCTDSLGYTQTEPDVWATGHPQGCITCENTTSLDCDQIRLARLMKTPCLHVAPGKSGGSLRNGSYFATIAYSIKGEKVTDWFSPSNVQPIWFESNLQGALEITVEADNVSFDEFILVVVQTINQGTVAKRIGVYSTNTQKIYLDNIAESLISVPIEQLPIQTPVYEKSDQIVEVNNYLLRVGPTGKFDFNYQPLANLIQAKWVSVEYNPDYYVNGGYKPSYLRDEVYSFFIRWVYNTGDKSSSYHIPGRPPVGNELAVATGGNVLFTDPTEPERVFEVQNTATLTVVSPPEILEDGGKVIARGQMGYWESTEYYPDNKPEVWNSSTNNGAPCWTAVTTDIYDLCGKPIRHHKFPDNITSNSQLTNHFYTNPATKQTTIRLLGVEFDNIICPKDNEGNDIKGIVGYEILRGSREGNKTVIAKGMLNNLRPYNIKGPGNANRKGLYPNYPFNTIVPLNPASGGDLNTGNQANDPYIVVTDNDDDRVNVTKNDIPTFMNTFHSPDTNFRNPYLDTVELKLYGVLSGLSEQYFIEPDQHPKNKLISNNVITVMILAGALEALLSIGGDVSFTDYGGSYNKVYGIPQTWVQGGTTINAISNQAYNANFNGSQAFIGLPFLNATSTYNAALAAYYSSSTGIADAFTNYTGLDAIYNTYRKAGNTYTAPSYTVTNSTSRLLGTITAITQTLFYFSQGAELALRTIYAIIPYRQYALQMLAHGYYSDFSALVQTQLYRFKIGDELYLNDNVQDLKPWNNNLYRVNNLKRQRTVLLRTTSGAGLDTGPYFITGSGSTGYYDQSLLTIGTARNNGLGKVEFDDTNKTSVFNAKIASHYGAIKVRLRNQYGQLDSIKQVPITPCEQKINLATIKPKKTGATCIQIKCDGTRTTVKVEHKIVKTPVLFNGDTYVNRYTEKNNMFFFNDWLYGQPDGYEYNYFIRQMLPEPRFWMNSQRYETTDLFSPDFNPPPGTGWFPRAFYQLDNSSYNYSNDNEGDYAGLFNMGIREAYFYLAASSVRDFFVESEVLVDYREAGPEIYQKFYNPYSFTDLPVMFNINPDQITRGNYYAYDYSLSIGKLYTQYFSQGNLQSRYYDPQVSSLCFTYRPDRIIYSLPQGFESAKDSWFIYLANNYKEFKDQISGVKNFARTGIFITFKNSSPQLFQGVDQLQTEAGVKVTLGDGGLFDQTPQSVSIADNPYEYGSCQSRNSVIATPAGMFYISQNQGKIFKFGQDLDEISQLGLKWWFVLYLPYKIIEDFPNYPHLDNPVAGVGCQSMYNNRDTIAYFCKKDFKLKDEFKDRTVYDECRNVFIVDGTARFRLGDPLIFHDASWTVSFDPKSKFFISFHDWHPDLLIPSKNTFLSVKDDSIWVHNDACTQFCNFYDTPAVMEIELPITTGQTVTTLRSVEYILEAYRRYDCIDQFHILDQNFDHAFIYNSEQVSGHMHLNIFPKNNITLAQEYPIINPNSISILYSKEENKYRFNQFWDITRDRGEFPVGSNYPPTGPVIPGTTILDGPRADERIWITQPNGYIRDLNPANLDYNKSELQRKKFRHYLNYLVLRKDIVGDVDMILKLTNAKQVYSPR